MCLPCSTIHANNKFNHQQIHGNVTIHTDLKTGNDVNCFSPYKYMRGAQFFGEITTYMLPPANRVIRLNTIFLAGIGT